MTKNNILITGCAGLFGINFSNHLLKKGYKIIGLDNLSGGYKENLPKHENFTFIKTDIWNDSNLDQIFTKHNIGYVYHFAVYAAAGYSPFVREFNYTNNLMVSAALINTSIRTNIEKFIFLSSMEIYGNATPPFTEEMAESSKPETPYGIAKRAVELDLEAANIHHGLKYTIIRPHNVQGVNQNIWDRYRNVLGIFIRKSLTGEDLLVHGDGSQIRAFSDVDYYMEPLEIIMNAYNKETFNIGADKPSAVLELAKIVQKIAMEEDNTEINIKHAEARNEVHAAFCDHSKAKSLLGFNDETDLEILSRKMYIWAKGQPKRNIKKIKPEVNKGLYSFWK